MTPVDDSVRPVGSDPEVKVQVYGPTPPEACRGAEYGAPIVPPGRVPETVTPVTTAIVSDAVTLKGILLESMALTVKLDVPAAVGVPVMAPFDAPRLSPAGSEPVAMLHTNGAVPPLIVSGAL
jgi:hypothetical protein